MTFLFSLTLQEEDKKIKAYAIIPPMLDPQERKLRFINRNGLMSCTSSEFKEMRNSVYWSASEQAVFKEKYLERPKQFGLIADILDKKVLITDERYYASDDRHMGVKQK